MNTYLSTFISGLQKPVEQLLRENLNVLQISLLLDGTVIYQTNEDIKKIQHLRFLNNTFLVLEKFKNLQTKDNPFNYMLHQVISMNLDVELKDFLQGAKTFRIVASDENKCISLDKKLVTEVENKICKRLNLKVDSHKPRIEF